VERYHTSLRRAYKIILSELALDPRKISKKICLQITVKAVNDTAGYDDLIPTLLVFDSFPRMTDINPPSLTTTERAAAIRRAMKKVAKIHAKRQVREALQMRNGSQKNHVRDLSLNSEVLVWRIHQKT